MNKPSQAKSTVKRKKVESTFADKWDPANVGDVLQGTYVGAEVVAAKRKGEVFTVYHLVDDDGKTWSIAGAYLKGIMKQIPRKAYIFVTFTGIQEMDSGNKMNMFDVEVGENVELVDPYADIADSDED